jgi:thiamine-monophosphate kinase
VAGEIGIIRRWFSGLTPRRPDVVLGIGDDAALLEVPARHELAVSTDTLVEGVDFPAGADAYDVGFKALAVNLSDLAAMGAEPRWATLALTMPSADDGWLERFAAGFREIAGQFNVALVGGDLGRGPLNVTVQIMGVVPAGTALRRDAARVGDLVYVTGELGGAALALRLLGAGARPSPESLQRLYRPMPRVVAGSRLRAVAHAAIDVSDGLCLDLARVAEASGVGAEIELDRVPVCEDVLAIGDRDERMRLALATGDDYELCFTAPPDSDRLLAALGTQIALPVTRIGMITSREGVRWRWRDGSEFHPDGAGYQHF